jgi:hypothetical protein
VLNDDHAAEAASNEAGPGPVVSNAECTSGGRANQIGAVTNTFPANVTTQGWGLLPYSGRPVARFGSVRSTDLRHPVVYTARLV